MGVLQRFERRLGGLVAGAFAKLFKGGVEPVVSAIVELIPATPPRSNPSPTVEPPRWPAS